MSQLVSTLADGYGQEEEYLILKSVYTVRELTCRIRRSKLRARGLYRVSMTMVASDAMCNLRRIWRYQQAETSSSSFYAHFCFISLVNELVAPFIRLLGALYFDKTAQLH